MDSALKQAAGKANAREGQAIVRDGTRLAYSLCGRGEKRLALVHSLAMDRHFWDPVAERLAEQAEVLIYDCRGSGQSDKPDVTYTVDLFADDLADLFDHVGWRKTLVAGASMGGCVSLAFAARHPERTAALGLIDTTAWYGPEAPKAWAERAEKAKSDGLAALVNFQVTRWFGDKFRAEHPDIVQRCVDTFLRNDVAAYAQSCRMLGTADLRSALSRIYVPTCVVVGEEDYAAPPAMAEAMHQGIAGSTLTVLPGARHLTPLEQPDTIAGELLRLLARMSP